MTIYTSEPAAGAPPDPVGHLAAAHGFGDLLDIRPEVPMTKAVLAGGGTAVVSIVLLWLITVLGGEPDEFSLLGSVLHVVAVCCFSARCWASAM